jgi:hypothetical protein
MNEDPNESWGAMDEEEISLRPDVQYENQIRAEAMEEQQAQQAAESQPTPTPAGDHSLQHKALLRKSKKQKKHLTLQRITLFIKKRV